MRVGLLVAMVGWLVVGWRLVAAETTYQGTLLEVVDRLGADHPELIVGLDPALLHQQGGKPLQFAAGDDWQTALKAALLPLNLTTLTMKQYPDVLITSPSALMAHLAQQGLAAGQFTQAAQQFQAALKTEPDHPQVQALLQFASDLAPLHAEVAKREAALDRALKERANLETLANRLIKYDESWTAMWQSFWLDYQRARQRGLQTELAPLFSFAANQCERYTDLLAQSRRRNANLVDDQTMAEIKEIQRELSSARLVIEGQVKRSQLYLTQGEKLYADKQYEQALPLLHQAFDLMPGDLRARTYLGWLQARARRERRAEEDAYLAKLAKAPDRADLLLALRRHADWVASGPVPRQAALLLALLEQGNLGVALDEPLHSRLASLAATRIQAPLTGQVDGLVTQGGEYTGGELFPVSVTLGPRRDLSRHHELVLNDLNQDYDIYMQVSFVQALSWLDQQARGILRNYRVVIHFKDLESAKGGDSLGAALATAGFSSLYQLPVRPGTTMTGSVRAYGGVAAVGGLPAKLEAALRARKQTLVMPRDNAADLAVVAQSRLAALRVLLAENIKDYLLPVLEGTVEPAQAAAWQQADDLYWLARAYQALGLATEAHGIFKRVLAQAPNDFTARQAVALFERGQVPARMPEWLESFSLTTLAAPVAGTPAGPAMPAVELARQVALHATLAHATPETVAMGEALLTLAQALDPDCREARLLKARIILKQGITAPADDAGMLPKPELAKALTAYAQHAAGQSEPRDRALANLCWALVLEYADPQHDAALIAFAIAADQGHELRVQPTLAAFAAAQAVAAPVTAPAGFALTPLAVPVVDEATLPASGRVWGEFGLGSAPAEATAATAPPPRPGERLPAADQSPAAVAEPARIDIPSGVEVMKLAANGAVLVIKPKLIAELLLFSVPRQRLIGKIGLPSGEVVFGCGRSLIVVYDRVDHKLTSYAIDSGRRIRTAAPSFKHQVVALEMGCDEQRVATLRVAAGTAQLDAVYYASLKLSTLATELYTKGMQARNQRYRDREQMRFDPDGERFAAWCTSHSPSGVIVGKVDANGVSYLYQHSTYGHILPLPGSALFVCGGGQVLNAEGNVVKTIGKPLFPDVMGRYILATDDAGRVEVYHPRTLALLGTAQIPGIRGEDLVRTTAWAPGELTADRYIVPISDYRTLVVLASDGMAIHFMPFHVP